eukprot:8387548-Alexandrium_andersonii.AAC.1
MLCFATGHRRFSPRRRRPVTGAEQLVLQGRPGQPGLVLRRTRNRTDDWRDRGRLPCCGPQLAEPRCAGDARSAG